HKYPDVNCNETTWDNQCLEHRQNTANITYSSQAAGSGKEIRNHASSFSAKGKWINLNLYAKSVNILKGTRNIAALIPNVEGNSTPQWDFDSITESINLNFSVKIAANSFLLRLDCKITRENTTELEHVNEKMFVHKTLMRVKWQFKISMLTATFF
uniref:MAM domain-containing protein n=1 Tax=Loa loa TaxID=7209 RepID=A0A1I7VBV5_LOALO